MIGKDDIDLLPPQPGVYIMRNASGEVLYIGKAIDIQKRVRSHWGTRDGHLASPFMTDVEKVDYVITDTDSEAFLLEYNLIKKHHPPHNVKLKDDKRYPYLKITVHETFPRMYLTRTVEADGSKYFGPYPHVTAARRTLAALHEIFPVRDCKYDSKKLLKVRPCIEYEMGRCCAPCAALVTPEEYAELCRGVIEFVRGHHEKVKRILQERMQECSGKMLFEKASLYRDIIHATEEFSQRQKMASRTVDNQDYIGYARVHNIGCVLVARRRNGRIVGSSHHFLDDFQNSSEEEIISSFLLQYYSQAPEFPREILVDLPVPTEDRETLEKWFEELAEHRVTIRRPHRGDHRKMIELAEKNSRARAAEQFRKLRGFDRQVDPAVIALQKILDLETLPLRIEGYDISNTQGDETVASMVVFREGRPQKSGYRRFKIQGVQGVDDCASMREILSRRFTHGDHSDENEKKRFAHDPDLLLIDGGRGQLNAALEVLQELGLERYPVVSLAKREEEVYLPDEGEPLRLDRRHEGLRLLQRVRDEAHRFAITYHRERRSKKLKKSALSGIQGIGPAKERLLLRRFGSVEKIR
ncbi:MAG: excinuclease ABC subunit UvrC, partial [bacterium]